MIKSFAIHISGRVQGVFFRASAKEKADTLGVKGFVRNEPDGSVFIQAEGEENAVIDFIDWCKHGPPQAKVERCDIKEIKSREFDSFLIRR